MNFSQRKPDYPCALCMEAGRNITRSKHVTTDRGHEFKLARVASDKTVIMECNCGMVAEVDEYGGDAAAYVTGLHEMGWSKAMKETVNKKTGVATRKDLGWLCTDCFLKHIDPEAFKEKKKEEKKKKVSAG